LGNILEKYEFTQDTVLLRMRDHIQNWL